MALRPSLPSAVLLSNPAVRYRFSPSGLGSGRPHASPATVLPSSFLVMVMWRTRWKRARDRLLQWLPFSEQNGLRALSQCRLHAWLARSDRASWRCDGSVGVLLCLSALSGLLALAFSSSWFAALAGLAMAAAMFAMAGELWIDQEAEKVREAAHRRGLWSTDGR